MKEDKKLEDNFSFDASILHELDFEKLPKFDFDKLPTLNLETLEKSRKRQS